VQTVIALALLAAVLGMAVARPRRLPELVAAGPAALLAVGLGLVSARDAGRELAALGPTVAFLAAILVLAHLADAYGVFPYAGALAAQLSRGTPQRLLGLVFAVAAAVTVVLSLDATVVLLTPVVFATAARMGVPARPHAYACAHIANAGSLLLPVSNLTNLLAFAACGLTFGGFAAVMTLPWLAVLLVEYLIFRRFFAADLRAPARRTPRQHPPLPRFALGVLAATLVGFVLAEQFDLHPAWAAAVGALVLAVPRLRHRPAAELRQLVVATKPAFCAFVLALGVVVLAVRQHGLGPITAAVLPDQPGLLGLLLTAAVAAVLANVVNNLPATLVLVPAVAPSTGLVLAVLIGVNVGPNLTYVGSLATLLWRRILHAHDASPQVGHFLRLGALSVPACLVVGVAALWLSLQLGGLS